MKKNTFYQPSLEIQKTKQIPSSLLWLHKPTLFENTKCPIKDILEVSISDVDSPTFVTTEDEIAVWVMDNIETDTVSYDGLAGNIVFCLGKISVNAIKHPKGVTLQFFHGSLFTNKDLTNKEPYDIWNYFNNDEVFKTTQAYT